MTDFRQQQIISTLTAPAARGFTPHSLVQPGTLFSPYPATETLYLSAEILYRLTNENATGKISLLFCFCRF